MRNTEVEKTIFIDMNRVAQDAGLLDENDRYADGSLRGWFDMYYRIPKRNIPVNPQATRYEVSEKDLSYYKRGIFNP